MHKRKHAEKPDARCGEPWSRCFAEAQEKRASLEEARGTFHNCKRPGSGQQANSKQRLSAGRLCVGSIIWGL